MKKTVFSVVIGLLALATGIIISGDRIPHPLLFGAKRAQKKNVPSCSLPEDLQEILNVDYCDLMRHPERYDGRIVRTRAVMLAQSNYEPRNDRVSLGVSACEPELWVREGFHLMSRTCPEVMKALDSLLMRDDPSYPRKNAGVIVVGRFISPKSTLNLETEQTRYESSRLTIVSIERAESLDD
jgi:hypothetical protein